MSMPVANQHSDGMFILGAQDAEVRVLSLRGL